MIYLSILEQSKSEDVCMVFITTEANLSKESQIINIKVIHFVYDVQYKFETFPDLCTNRSLQSVGILLICQGKKGILLYVFY